MVSHTTRGDAHLGGAREEPQAGLDHLAAVQSVLAREEAAHEHVPVVLATQRVEGDEIA